MYGAAIALKEMEKRQRFEDRRKKWIETKTEKGKKIEYLMVECENCKHPQPRQKVLRFKEHDFQEWKEIKRSYYTDKDRITMLLSIPVFMIIGVLAGFIFKSVSVGLCVFVASGIIFSLIGCYLGHKRTKRLDENQLCILSRYGNYTKDQVGTIDEYSREYVVIKEGQSL